MVNKYKHRDVKPLRYFLYLTTLSSIGFFKPIFLDDDAGIYKYMYGILLAISIILSVLYGKRSSFFFDFPFKILITSVLVSVISATLFWNQQITYSIFASLSPVLGYVFYYFLVSYKIEVATIEGLIVWLGVTFCIFYITSFIIYPIKIFHYAEATDRSIQRIFLNGEGFLFLFYFLSINKFSTTSKYKWIIFAIVAFICILLNQTRVFIVSSTIITLWYILRSQKMLTKIFTVLTMVSLLFYLSQLEVIKVITSKTGEQLSEFEDYIRFRAAEYYLTTFQKSPITYVIGNGWGYGDKTDYGKKILDLQKGGYFLSDLGLIGLFVHLGILSIVAYIILFYKSLRSKLNKSDQFLKMFIVFIILAGVTTSATFQAGYIFPIVFTFYLIGKKRIVSH